MSTLASLPGLSTKDFARLRTFIQGEIGIQLPPEKRLMLEGRLRTRLRALGMVSFEAYCNHVFNGEAPEEEIRSLLDAVTTNKTDFFREPAHFDYLTRVALPELMRNSPERSLKVWSAGCSTGEEPYTLAVVISEFAAASRGPQWSILATDISTRVLDHARRAVYNGDTVRPIPVHLLRKYFLRSRDQEDVRFRVAPELRRTVEFRRLNLMSSDFGIAEHVDTIFCRNVIIYFDREAQHRLLEKFTRQLRPGGYLFLGHSESISGYDLEVESVAPTVYRKRHGC